MLTGNYITTQFYTDSLDNDIIIVDITKSLTIGFRFDSIQGPETISDANLTEWMVKVTQMCYGNFNIMSI